MDCHLYIGSVSTQRGITLEDVSNFNEFLDGLSDVEIALSMYLAAGSSITAGESIHVDE